MREYQKIIIFCIVIAIATAAEIDEAISKHLQEQQQARDKPLTHLSYDDIVQTFYELEKEFPEYIRVFDAVEQFNNVTLPQTICFRDGDTIKRPCKYIYAQMTNFSDPNHKNFTQSFFSGNFHGDEVVGPNIVTYLAKYILEKPLLKMLSNNFLVLLPLGNPSGYFLNKREEQQIKIMNGFYNHIDMNRDFPYDQKPNECFQTAGARIINYIWQKHLFTAAITFHGGMTAIGWPWGSTNHVTNRQGDLSPDQKAFFALGKRMSEIADYSGMAMPQQNELSF